jgi:hypothetical protein
MGTKFSNEIQKEKGEKNKITKYKKQKVNNKQARSKWGSRSSKRSTCP